MKIPYKRWEEAIKVRHSSRTYTNQPITSEDEENLSNFIKMVNQDIDGVRAVLIRDGGERVVHSIAGSYGIIQGVRSYLAFIANKDADHSQEKIGYLGEMCILEATSIGLSTCWISGTFKPQIVREQIKLAPQEKIAAISPIGYKKEKKSIIERLMKKAIGSHRRKPIRELCPAGFKQDWPDWIKDAIDLARLAPSAVNKQPWRFRVSENLDKFEIVVDDLTNIKRKQLDCGIAMLHIEIGALSHGIMGEWNYLEKPGIAVFNASL